MDSRAETTSVRANALSLLGVGSLDRNCCRGIAGDLDPLLSLFITVLIGVASLNVPRDVLRVLMKSAQS